MKPQGDTITRREIVGPSRRSCPSTTTSTMRCRWLRTPSSGWSPRVAMRIESGVVAVNRGVLGDPAAPFGNQSRADSPERAAQWNSLFSKRSTLPWMSSTKLDVARAGAVEFFSDQRGKVELRPHGVCRPIRHFPKAEHTEIADSLTQRTPPLQTPTRSSRRSARSTRTCPTGCGRSSPGTDRTARTPTGRGCALLSSNACSG